MFVNREHVDSVRITPSSGDGGVDILDRGAGPNGTDVVYQVERYTRPLDTKQKGEVEKSLRALVRDPRWAGLNVGPRRLVTPWDPTPEAQNWLHDLAIAHGVSPRWRGLTYVEQLVAKYPDIVDYYLNGGADRIKEAHTTAAALFGVERGEPSTDVGELVQRIQRTLTMLDTDPHYRYELRFGEGSLPPVPSRPRLAMTWMSGDTRGGPWIAVDVIARCAASAQERPITVTGGSPTPAAATSRRSSAASSTTAPRSPAPAGPTGDWSTRRVAWVALSSTRPSPSFRSPTTSATTPSSSWRCSTPAGPSWPPSMSTGSSAAAARPGSGWYSRNLIMCSESRSATTRPGAPEPALLPSATSGLNR